jgi:hypothetical protein
MDKKPLIVVSILAVVLLVLGSLSNVVGYQSVISTTVSDSPLFTTRTQRATEQQQKVLTSRYLGMGMYALTFPLRDNRTEQLKRVIERLQRMDDKEFASFTTFCVQRAKQYDAPTDMNPNAIIRTLHVLRTHPVIIDSFLHKNTQNSYSTSPWRPGCFIDGLFDLLFLLILFILFIYIAIFVPNFTSECGSPT